MKVSFLISQFSNLANRLGNLKAFSFTGTCDSGGSLYIPISTYGCSIVYSAVTNTANTVCSLFLNEYGMWYVRLRKGDGTAWTSGSFTIYALGA